MSELATENCSPPRAAQEIQKRRAVRRGFEAWCRYRGYAPAQHHRLIIGAVESFLASDEHVLLIFAPPGSAKALALHTPIPTPGGWKQMGELRVGDRVFDENGLPCNVVRVSEVWRDRPVYKVRTDCGDEIVADADHEWLVRLCGKPAAPNKGLRPTRWRKPFKIKKTHELCRRRAKRPMITHAKALELPDVELPLDPYLLGIWLGDGHSSTVAITSSLEDQAWLRPELERLGYEIRNRSVLITFGVADVRGRMVRMGLIHDPAHQTFGRKYIPQIYMRASRQQRLSLLQGLIDTDGTVCKKRGCTTFCTINKDLALSVQELVRSLGVKAGLVEGRAKLYEKDCGAVYRVSFYMANSARMPRKAALCRDQYRTPNTYVEVEPAGIADTVCITVDSPSHLFLCGRSMTPTHNSSYASVLLPPWYLANHPKAGILFATHSVEFAERWGRRVRNDIAAESLMLGIELSDDNKAAGRWSLKSGGEYYAVGAGTGISGYRADLGIIDDPFGSREDAYSETVRKGRWNWYLDDFSARLKPDAKRVIIATRWHQEDISGMVLEQIEKGQVRGKIISIAAVAEEDDCLGRAVGDYLWDDPKGYNYGEFLRSRQRETSPMMWSALYQQRPAPEEGDYFKSEWLVPYDVAPERSLLRVYGASDYAVTADGGDYTVHVVVGLDPDGKMYLLDLWRKQAASDEWIEAFCDLVLKWKPMAWAEEQGQIRAGIGPFLDRRQRERSAYVAREGFPSRADKSVRAQSIRGRMALQKLYVPVRASWYPAFRSELLTFPAGKFDDAVDSLSLIGQLLDVMVAGQAAKVTKNVINIGYRRLERQVEGFKTY